jgi:hypothetical protein
MIFLQKDHDAVLEFDALRLMRLELVQLGRGNLFPGFVLLRLKCARPNNKHADRKNKV